MKAVAKELETKAARDPNTDVRKAARAALRKLADPKGAGPTISALTDPNIERRLAARDAYAALVRHGRQQAGAPPRPSRLQRVALRNLARTLKDSKLDSHVRAYAAEGIVFVAGRWDEAAAGLRTDAVAVLIDGLAYAEPVVRRAAVQALYALDRDQAEDIVLGVFGINAASATDTLVHLWDQAPGRLLVSETLLRDAQAVGRRLHDVGGRVLMAMAHRGVVEKRASGDAILIGGVGVALDGAWDGIGHWPLQQESDPRYT
jgi:HEAT repeat protein